MASNSLIIFVKNPIPGRVKTRLAKDIGDEKAVWVYKKLLNCTAQVIEPLEVEKSVWYGDEVNDNDLWNGLSKHQQPVGDLGHKMSSAFEHTFKKHDKVCIIGSDCPQLTSEILEQAYDALDNNEFVVGPAMDGGYYLLGMRSFQPSVFDSVNWSTSEVFKQTLANMDALASSYHILEKLRDVDDVHDLDALGLIIP